MFKGLILLAVVAAALAHVHNEETMELFVEYVKDHNKEYANDPVEFAIRYNIFASNLDTIAFKNAQQPSAYFAVNKYTDRLYEEMPISHIPYTGEALAQACLTRGVTMTPYTPEQIEAIPVSWDWRSKNMVTPVKNQGDCGSCWTFSTTGAIESAWAIAGKGLTGLSEQMIVDCSHGCANESDYGPVCNQGCDGGWPWSAMNDIVSWGGIETETAYPYTGEDGNCANNPTKYSAKIKNYTCVSGPLPADETQMATFLYNNGPLSIAMDADDLMSYSSGIINDPDCDATSLDHAILIVGYGVDSTSNLNYWIVKNSWGSDWGENGYFRIVRGSGMCGVNEAVTFPIVNTN